MESCFHNLLFTHLLLPLIIPVHSLNLLLLLDSPPCSFLPFAAPLLFKVISFLSSLILPSQEILLLHLQMMLSHHFCLMNLTFHFRTLPFRRPRSFLFLLLHILLPLYLPLLIFLLPDPKSCLIHIDLLIHCLIPYRLLSAQLTGAASGLQHSLLLHLGLLVLLLELSGF